MKLRRNGFYTFALLVFIFCIFLSLAFALQRVGNGQEYPYLPKGIWLLGSAGGICLFIVAGSLAARLDIVKKLDKHHTFAVVLETVLASAILIAGLVIRMKYIETMPMDPDSDYKTYYEMAVLIKDGTLTTEGIGYCDYVAMFPHVYGYPAVLSIIFRIFGSGVMTALRFNVILEMGSCYVIWRIVRLCAGRFGAMLSLAIAAAWPSYILFSNFVASEPLFTFVILAAIHLFAMSMQDTEAKEKHPWLCTFELAGLGIMLGFAGFIRPMAMIFLVAAVICMFPGSKDLPEKPLNDIPLGFRAVNKGWKRCLIVLAVYMLVSRIFTMGVGYAVDRGLAGGSSSYGYNLLVGLNLESYGGWNQEDADYLYDAYENTGSAEEAHLACRDMALERLKVDPRALLDLFVHKFEVLWGNDDYGASWNILFMDQQEKLTPERESFYYQAMDFSTMYYMFVLLIVGIGGLILFKRKPDAVYAVILFFCGTVALHLLVENQNRYHYHTLSLLIIVAGVTAHHGLGMCYKAFMARLVYKKRAAQEAERRKEAIRIKQEEADNLRKLRADALHTQFDMGSAIADGHIRIVASQAVAEASQQEEPDKEGDQ